MSSKKKTSTKQGRKTSVAKPRKTQKANATAAFWNAERAARAADPVRLAEALADKDIVRQHHLAGIARALSDLDHEYPGIVKWLGTADHHMLDTLDLLDLMHCFDVAVQVMQPIGRHHCRDFWPELYKGWIAQKTVTNLAKLIAAGELYLPGVPKNRLRLLRQKGVAA